MVALWYILVCYLIALPFALLGIGEYTLAMSFYMNAALIAYMSRKSLVENVAGPAFATVNIFYLLFFYVAPIFQFLEFPGYLINNYVAPLSQMLLANLLVFLFFASFCALYFKSARMARKPFLKTGDNLIESSWIRLIVLAALMGMWALYVMLSTDVDLTEDAAEVENITTTLRHKIGYVIPFAVLGYYLSILRHRRSLVLVALLILFVLLSKNIFLDRRNALGPVYLSVLFLLAWKGRINSRSVFLFLAGGLLVAFPFLSIFINNSSDRWGELINPKNIFDEIGRHFVDMHYDAWASLIASIEFVQVHGLQFGRQLVGALLVFFPRELWPDKPVSSAEMVGGFLVQNHGLWFTNISMPLPAEGYLDFGPPGLILFALGLAWYAGKLDYFINNGSAVDRTSSLYFAIYLTFVMRGSFLPAFAYGAGAYVAINVVPAILTRLSLTRRHEGQGMVLTDPGKSAIRAS